MRRGLGIASIRCPASAKARWPRSCTSSIAPSRRPDDTPKGWLRHLVWGTQETCRASLEARLRSSDAGLERAGIVSILGPMVALGRS